MKNIEFFIRKFSVFGSEIFSIYLNRRVFVMCSSMAVPLLHSFIVFASVVAYMAYVLTLFVLHLSPFCDSVRLCFVFVAFP